MRRSAVAHRLAALLLLAAGAGCVSVLKLSEEKYTDVCTDLRVHCAGSATGPPSPIDDTLFGKGVSCETALDAVFAAEPGKLEAFAGCEDASTGTCAAIVNCIAVNVLGATPAGPCRTTCSETDVCCVDSSCLQCQTFR